MLPKGSMQHDWANPWPARSPMLQDKASWNCEPPRQHDGNDNASTHLQHISTTLCTGLQMQTCKT
eukprot:12500695-Alexandrium_andersonii.AAC.1